jgi:hypothetical protein
MMLERRKDRFYDYAPSPEVLAARFSWLLSRLLLFNKMPRRVEPY